MIESSFLEASPWNSDPFLCKDLFPGIESSCYLETEIQEQEYDDRFDKLTLSSCSSPVHSVSTSSSDAGDWVSFDMDNCNFFATTQNLLSGVLDEESIVDPLGLGTLGWSTFSESVRDCTASNDSSSDNVSSTSSSSRRKRKYSEMLNPLTSKSWSRMSCEEQLKTVEALTEIISNQMGLREQLEVIRIIDPSAVVSPTDTEFVIDLANLNDVKLKLIRDFVQKCALFTSSDVTESNSLQSSASSVKSEASLTSSQSTKGKVQKKQSREKRSQLKALSLRERKEYRQLMKEKRSGLFVNEEVMSLGDPQEDDEDINILE